MARVCKTLIPEQGYAHRDHRSKNGMVKAYNVKKSQRIRKQEIEEMRRQREMDRQEMQAQIEREQWNSEWQ